MSPLATQALVIWDTDGPEKTIAWLRRDKDVLAAVTALGELGVEMYWQRKDLPSFLLAARGGIERGLTSALPNTTQGTLQQALESWEDLVTLDPNDPRYTLLSQVKGLAFNVASFTWPGWDEPGIAISTSDVEQGLAAAHLNLFLATRLRKGPLPTARAHWMLFAQLLEVKGYEQARREIEKAIVFARETGAEKEILLAEGYRALLDGAEGVEAKETFDAIVARLKLLEAEGLAGQLQTSWAHYVDRPSETRAS